MKKTINNNVNGITLIALVISIIVLLILAGVAISMLSGENGILKKAGEAKKQTEEVNEFERVSLAVVEALSFNQGNLTKTNLAKALKIDGSSLIGFNQWYYIGQKNRYLITSRGNVILTKLNIGDYVDLGTNILDKSIKLNGTENILSDWRILYEDGEYIYVILADYMPNTTNGISDTENSIIKLAGLSSSGTYGAYSSSRTKLLTSLNNTAIWNDLLSSNLIDKGATVYGGADLTLWVNSWNNNENCKTKFEVKYTTDTEKYASTGYLLGYNNEYKNVYKLESDSGRILSLYFPHCLEWSYGEKGWNKQNHVDYYWLLSESALNAKHTFRIGDGDRIRTMHYDGDLQFGYHWTGVRPMVKLEKSNINLEQDREELSLYHINNY